MKNVRKASRELSELINKQEAFTSRRNSIQSELEIEIEKAGEQGIESGIIEGAKIAEKQADLSAIEAVLIGISKRIPKAEKEAKAAKREAAENRLKQLAKANNTLLVEASKQLIKIAEMWLSVNERVSEAENLRGQNPGVSYPLSIQRNSIFEIESLIMACVCKAVKLNPEIEPLLQEFEQLGLGKRL